MHDVDCLVVGGGVVGLAVARELARAGREVVVVEAEPRIGMHTSSRNSEVIHAGIYYATGSAKARLCVRGKELLYRYCSERGVPHRRIGKIIVAVGRGDPYPRTLPGASDRERRTRSRVARRHRGSPPRTGGGRRTSAPSPSTGIVDSHALMQSLKTDVLERGGQVVLSTPVLAARPRAEGIEVDIGGADPATLRCRTMMNCAGHGAQDIARRTDRLAPEHIPASHFAKGQYFVHSGAPPSKAGLSGPHAGRARDRCDARLAGSARFGPQRDVVERPRLPLRRDPSRGILQGDPNRLPGTRPKVRSSPATSACGPSCPAPESLPRTSCSKAPRTTEFRTW